MILATRKKEPTDARAGVENSNEIKKLVTIYKYPA